MPGSVVGAVERDLEKIRERDADLAESALAATALALARELDGSNSATSKSMCAKALNDTMSELRELCPPEREKDAVDELKQLRERRRSGHGGAGTARQPGP